MSLRPPDFINSWLTFLWTNFIPVFIEFDKSGAVSTGSRGCQGETVYFYIGTLFFIKSYLLKISTVIGTFYNLWAFFISWVFSCFCLYIHWQFLINFIFRFFCWYFILIWGRGMDKVLYKSSITKNCQKYKLLGIGLRTKSYVSLLFVD